MVVAHNVPVEVCSNCAEVFSGPEAGRIRDEAIFRAQGPRAATVTASIPTRVVVLDAKGFAAVVKEMPSVALKVMRGLAERLRAVEATL